MATPTDKVVTAIRMCRAESGRISISMEGEIVRRHCCLLIGRWSFRVEAEQVEQEAASSRRGQTGHARYLLLQ